MSSGAGPASAAGAFVRSGERVPGRVRRRSETSRLLPGAPIGPRCLVRGAAGRRVLLGHLGGQGGESSTAAGHGVDAQGMQAFAELGGSDGLAGNPAGEQPPGSDRESHPGVPAVAYPPTSRRRLWGASAAQHPLAVRAVEGRGVAATQVVAGFATCWPSRRPCGRRWPRFNKGPGCEEPAR